MTVIYKNELEEKDMNRIFEEAQNCLAEQEVAITQAKMILNDIKKESLAIQQNGDEVELQVTIKWIDHRPIYAQLMQEQLGVSNYDFVSETFNVGEVLNCILNAANEGREHFEFGGYSYSLAGRDITPKLASVDDLYRVFVGERSISDENLLMNTTDVKPGVALIRLNIQFHEKGEGEEALQVDIHRYRSEQTYHDQSVMVYEVTMNYDSFDAKLAEHYRKQFYDRFKLNAENQENLYIGVTLS